MSFRVLLGVVAFFWGCAPTPRSDKPADKSAEREDVVILDVPPAKRASSTAKATVSAASEPVRRSLRGRWYNDEAEAVRLARLERRPLLIDFRAEWCAACKELQKNTFPDASFVKSSDRFVMLTVDATNEDAADVKALLQKYNVVGLPSVLLIDSSGHEQKRITSFVLPDELATQLDAVR